MGINRSTEYSIRALIYMAMNYSSEIITKDEICKTQGVTPGFLTKIMQPLLKAGLVKSFRGAKGGFQLARDPKEVTLYEVVQLIDNVMMLNACLVGEESCTRDNVCFMHTIWEEAKESVRDIFKKYTLHEIARQQVMIYSMKANKA